MVLWENSVSCTPFIVEGITLRIRSKAGGKRSLPAGLSAESAGCEALCALRPADDIRSVVVGREAARLQRFAQRRFKVARFCARKTSATLNRPLELFVGRSRYAAEKHQQFSFYPCGSGFPTAKNRGKMPLTQYLETNPSA
jgi:hypothetical protein